jgi:glutathione synthase
MSRASRIGIVMDPIHGIKPHKDTSLALMLAAKAKGASLFYMEPDDLYVQDGKSYGIAAPVDVFDDEKTWHSLGERQARPLTDFDVVLMRKDPPVDKRFIHTCYLLEQAVRDGVRVLNNPSMLVALNEKLFATHFPDLCPPTCIASDKATLRAFLDRHKTIVVKPLDSMGGDGIFQVRQDDVNFDVIWEVQTKMGTYPVVAQRFLPEIRDGDKRVVVIDGTPFPHVLVRTPREGSIRGNMAAGGSLAVRPINDTERAIGERVGKVLKEKGIVLSGLDIIGDRLTEINITSPTGLRQIEKGCGISLAAATMDAILRGR